jgi:hypothetical protein
MRTHKLRKRNPTMVLQGRLRKNLLATKDIHSRGLRTRQKPTPRVTKTLLPQPTAWITLR